MIESAPGLDNGSSVGYHADGALHSGQIAPRNDSRRLVIDSNLIKKTNRRLMILAFFVCVVVDGVVFFLIGVTNKRHKAKKKK